MQRSHTKMLAWIPWTHSLDSVELLSRVVGTQEECQGMLYTGRNFKLGVRLVTQRAMSGVGGGSSAKVWQEEWTGVWGLEM